jgi:hypothetical protein
LSEINNDLNLAHSMPPGAVHTNKHFGGFESLCTKRVFWIVGSTDRHLILLFHPGINARFERPPAGAGRT